MTGVKRKLYLHKFLCCILHVPFECLEGVLLGLKDASFCVRRVGAVEKVHCRGRHDFFHLGGKKHSCYADQLELGKRDDTCRKEAIDNVHSKIERFRYGAGARVDLDQSVGENSTRIPCQVLLAVHIVRVREGRLL
jgi:hypothetical protein